MQARGKGLCPVNTSCTSASLAEFLAREGYTDIRVASSPAKKKVDSVTSKPETRRGFGRSSAGSSTKDRHEDTTPAARRRYRTPTR